MKAFAGEFDRAFTEARLAEVRSLLDAGDALGTGVDVPPLDTADGYDGWAPRYDSPDNGIFVMEEGGRERREAGRPRPHRLGPGAGGPRLSGT